MTILSCKTCIHWTPVPVKYPNMANRKDKYLQGGICESENLMEAWGDSSYDKISLIYPYAEGGEFWTGPDFGCVHHKEKANKP